MTKTDKDDRMTTIDVAIAQSDAGANFAWKVAADEVIKEVATKRRVFTSDDIWDELFKRDVATGDHRAMGPRILSAVKNKVLDYQSCNYCGTAKVVKASDREESHAKHTTVYVSLVFKK